jgi:large subunit ribosomal protein L32e
MQMADEKTRLIRERAQKRATFRRQGASRKKKLEDTWRRPRGLQSKQRKQYRAKGRHPKPGYGAPAAVRGYHPCGLMEALVFNTAELEGLNPEMVAVRIGGSVGMKKRSAIQAKALEYGLRVLNPKEITAPEPVEEPEPEVEEDE